MNEKGGLTMNNKALSNLVATVLIVLLALAAVAIVWGFLRPMFEGSANQAGLDVACQLVEVEPVSCTYDLGDNGAIGGTGGNLDTATVVYRIKSDNEKLDGVLGVWEDAGGLTATQADPNGPPSATLVTQSITIEDYTANGLSGNPSGVRVAAVVADGGATETCDPSYVRVDCEGS